MIFIQYSKKQSLQWNIQGTKQHIKREGVLLETIHLNKCSLFSSGLHFKVFSSGLILILIVNDEFLPNMVSVVTRSAG